MQKIVTITLDTTQLAQGENGPFSVSEVDEINSFLELGWQVEEWEFLKEGEMDGQVILLVILNDNLMYEEEATEFDLDLEEEEQDVYEGGKSITDNKN